ncbi:S8 family serine peptidase, partial [Streptomyces sp. OF3]
MRLTRTLRVLATSVAIGALLLGAVPTAAADQVRDGQWPLKAFDTKAIWEISRGKGVTVAVIDDGVDAKHQDLRRSVLSGKSFLDSDRGGEQSEDSGRATAVASIIAGHGHGVGNASGVMGLAPDAKILPVAVDGSGSQIASAIRYAVDEGASVINVSDGGPDGWDALEQAVAYAVKKDVLVVAAVGDSGTRAEEQLYPASYPGVMSVGAVASDGEVWRESSRGPSVMVTAPGVGVVAAGGPTVASKYRKGSSTAYASAYVSAAGALLRSKFPELTAGQIANRLVKTAGLPPSAKGIKLPDERYGYGYIQPFAALDRDIPAGPKDGPLKDHGAADSATSSPDDERHPDLDYVDPNASSWNLPLIGGVFAAIVAGIVGLIVLLTRRRRPAHPAPVGYPPHAPVGYNADNRAPLYSGGPPQTPPPHQP